MLVNKTYGLANLIIVNSNKTPISCIYRRSHISAPSPASRNEAARESNSPVFD